MDKWFGVAVGATRAFLASSQQCSQDISGWVCSMLGWMVAHTGPEVTVLEGPQAGPWQLSYVINSHYNLSSSDFASQP